MKLPAGDRDLGPGNDRLGARQEALELATLRRFEEAFRVAHRRAISSRHQLLYRILDIARFAPWRITSPMALVDDLKRFVTAHRSCATLTGDASPPSAEGYLLWIDCSCGAIFERWVTPEAAEDDLLKSGGPGSLN